jgi:3-hydroxyisobutyrate dehydrogenase-like beta-hydroxyacid dehydrogenase
MGAAMARNLQRHLAAQKAPNMLYCNRTMSRGDALKPLGGVPEPSFERVVDECGIIFTMVATTHSPTRRSTIYTHTPRMRTRRLTGMDGRRGIGIQRRNP